jgi:hypothetical protein
MAAKVGWWRVIWRFAALSPPGGQVWPLLDSRILFCAMVADGGSSKLRFVPSTQFFDEPDRSRASCLKESPCAASRE